MKKEAKSPDFKHLRRTRAGQSLGEYTFIAALIVFIAVAAFMLLGQNMSRQMVHLKRDMKMNINSSALMASLKPKNAYTVTLQVPQADGTILTKTFKVQTNPTSSGSTATSGANGSDMTATQATSNALTQSELMEMGLTKEQAATMVTLANQAHKLGAILQIVETVVQESGGSADRFMKTSINFDGQTYTDAFQLSHLIAEGGAEWTTVEDLVTKLQQNGAMNDPVMSAYVTSQLQSIQSTITRLRTLVYETSFQAASGASTNMAAILNLNASALTHSDAKNICEAGSSGSGSGKDDGNYCFSLE